MKGETRRQEIIKRLSEADAPVSAAVLAAEHGVSRQIIVQDIALLRAKGAAIVSLSRGYRLEEKAACRPTGSMVPSGPPWASSPGWMCRGLWKGSPRANPVC